MMEQSIRIIKADVGTFLIKSICFLSFLLIFYDQKKDSGLNAYAIKNDRFRQFHFYNRKQIPVLCYHNVTKNSRKEDILWISEANLNEQLKMLHDSGYQTILPDQLYEYISGRTALPAKSILISFDDTHEEHFSIAAPVLRRYGFKAVFFSMTVCIGKKNFMTAAQIKILSHSGHVIGGHTWNHPAITTLKDKEWELQLINQNYFWKKLPKSL